MKSSRLFKCILILLLLIVSNDVWSQFENEAASVAFDNTQHQFFGDGFRPATGDSTVGDTAMRSFYRENQGGTAGAFLSFKGVTVTWDYKILTGIDPDFEFEIVGFDEFGELVSKDLPTDSTGGWRTDSFFLPDSVSFFQWFTFQNKDGGGILIDNVRIVRGNQSTNTSSQQDVLSKCNDENPFFENPLSRAVDNTLFNFETFENGFTPQNQESVFGGDALQSKRIPNGENVILVTGITSGQPYSLKWSWRVSSDPSNAELLFLLFDENLNPTSTIRTISGEQDWRTEALTVPSGTFFLAWFYSKANTGSPGGEDRGWIDKVEVAGLLDSQCLSLTPIYNLLID